MCGRFALLTPEKLASHFQLKDIPLLGPRYNIAPSQDIAVVRLDPDSYNRELVMLRWGLIPFWAKDEKISYRLINARGESVAGKPSFRAAFKHRRCLVAASGFYEWDHKSKTKQPFFVRLKDSDILAFAGLWEHWESEDGKIIESCTIITTGPNKLVGKIHDRMPAIIEPAKYEFWLDQQADKNKLMSLIMPYPDKGMIIYPVGKGVNSPKNDTPDCLTKIKEQ